MTDQQTPDADERRSTKTAARKAPRNRSGTRSPSLRTQNLSNVLTMLHLTGPATRSQICTGTGLTRSSVAALVGELESAELVQEIKAAPDGRPGRPSPIVDAAPGRAVLAFEVVVDSIAVAVVGLGGKVLSQRRYDRPRANVTVDQTMLDLARLTDGCLLDAGHPEILSAGVAVAGLIDHDTDAVVFAPNLGWDAVEIAPLIEEKCGVTAPISVRNEGELAARAEARRGAGRDCDDLIYLYAEVGIGGGILSQGQSIVGRWGLGGEIGHIPLNSAGVTCECGATGCFETEVGERALLTRSGLDPDGGRSATSAVLQRAKDGDETALAAFGESGRWLGLGIAGLANIFNPEKVILGGLYQPGFEFVIDEINAVFASRPFPTLDRLAIVPSELGDAAPLLGAAELAFDPILADPLAFQAAT